MKRQILKGAGILMFGVIISRLIGLFLAFPFAKLVKDQGITLFSYAFIPYSLFLDLSTLGITLAIAKEVSKNISNGNESKNKSFIKSSVFIFFLVGVLFFFIMFLIAKPYAYLVLAKNSVLENSIKDVTLVIKLISLSLIIIPVLAVIRGYLQGQLKYLVVSLSQILEQSIRAIGILLGSYICIKKLDLKVEVAIYVSVLMSFLGALVSILFLLLFLKFPKNSEKNKISLKEIKNLFINHIIPSSLYGIFFSLSLVIDSIFFNNALIKSGVKNPEYYFALYAFKVQRIIIIPISLFQCIGFSAIPNITKYFQKEKYKLVNKNVRKILKYAFMILIPITFITIYFKDYIYKLFFGDTNGSILLSQYAILILVFGLSGLLANIMQSLDLEKKLRNNLFIGIIIKLALTNLLILKYQAFGAILSSLIANLVVIILDLIIIFKKDYLKVMYYLKDLLLIANPSFISLLIVLLFSNIMTLNNITFIALIIVYLLLFYVLHKKITKAYYNNG